MRFRDGAPPLIKSADRGMLWRSAVEVKKYSSRRRLHGLQEREDLPQRIVAQHGPPHRHALVELALGHGLPKDARRIVSVTQLQPAEIARALALVGVRAVAVRAVLIERAPAFVDEEI